MLSSFSITYDENESEIQGHVLVQEMEIAWKLKIVVRYNCCGEYDHGVHGHDIEKGNVGS